MQHPTTLALSTALLALSCSAASSHSAATPSLDASSAPGSLTDSEIETLATSYLGFTKINRAPYPTRQHVGNPLVNVYANDLALRTYSSLEYGVTPDASVHFAAGSMLVKEMFVSDAGPPVLTVMYKAESGYSSLDDDWWFGRLGSQDGVPTSPDYAGTVSFCIACHSGAAASDYAWGVSTADR